MNAQIIALIEFYMLETTEALKLNGGIDVPMLK